MVFEENILKSMKLRNRVFRSATHEGFAESNGRPKVEELKNLYKELIEGEVGCIITGYTGVMQNGKSSLKDMLMIDKDEYIEDYKEITSSVHENGGRIIMQLAHCGAQTKEEVTMEELISPSGKKDLAFASQESNEMTTEDIEEVIEAFANGARRAKESGFDGVQLHIAHGYLLCQFISPYTNIRSDEYGGSIENRFRIIRRILARVREEVGDYLVMAKLNVDDNRSGGLKVEESLEVARLLEKYGCDAIELSCGVVEDGFYLARGNTPLRAIEYFTNGQVNDKTKDIILEAEVAFNLEKALSIRETVDIPLILVGGIRDYDTIEYVLSKGIDYVSMSRALIREPSLIAHYRSGEKRSSSCLSCNYCVVAAEKELLKCWYSRV